MGDIMGRLWEGGGTPSVHNDLECLQHWSREDLLNMMNRFRAQDKLAVRFATFWRIMGFGTKDEAMKVWGALGLKDDGTVDFLSVILPMVAMSKQESGASARRARCVRRWEAYSDSCPEVHSPRASPGWLVVFWRFPPFGGLSLRPPHPKSRQVRLLLDISIRTRRQASRGGCISLSNVVYKQVRILPRLWSSRLHPCCGAVFVVCEY